MLISHLLQQLAHPLPSSAGFAEQGYVTNTHVLRDITKGLVA